MMQTERFYPGQPTEAISERERRGRVLARRAAAEGMVLLENDGALPFRPGAKLALFGIGARHTVKGGTGSGDVNSRDAVSVDQGLRDAGFEIVNDAYLDALDAAYARAREEWEQAIYAAAGESRDAMAFYEAHARLSPRVPEDIPLPREACARADAAVYVISRVSGEGADRRDAPGDFRLSDAERAQLLQLRALCRRVVVVLNVGGIVDLDFVEQAPVAALVLMSQAGVEGGGALADLLSGRVNFSGCLTDTWARRYDDYPAAEGFARRDRNPAETFYTDGIYVGYRYFDSFGVRPRYPFGYGLSYTTFALEGAAARLEGTRILAEATVRNTGDATGRRAVQLYASCPAREQAKELKRLVAFGKTGPLAPGQAQTLSLSFDLEALASYRTGRAALTLERGDYILLAGFSAEDCAPFARLRLSETVQARRVRNVCELLDALKELESDGSARAALEDAARDLPVLRLDGAAQLLARRNGEPAAQAEDPALERARALVRGLSDRDKARLVVGARSALAGEVVGAAARTVPGAAGETVALPEQGVPGMVLADGPAGLRLQQRYEIDPDTGDIYGLTRFQTLENRFFGKLPVHPGAALRCQFATAIPVGTLLAQSFDTALMEEVGAFVAEELRAFGVSVWLAPGMNLHRDPLCGRNFEYYSEDPLLSGKMAAAIARGVQRAPGAGVCVKHFACNNQEDNRFHVNSVVSERALRELYLRGFEIAVREGRPLCIMTAYNRVNGVHAANSRDLCTALAREEWGFRGFIMTDWTTTNQGHGSSASKCIRAGNDLIMPGADSDLQEILDALTGAKDQYLPRAHLEESAARIVRAAWETNVRNEE